MIAKTKKYLNNVPILLQHSVLLQMLLVTLVQNQFSVDLKSDKEKKHCIETGIMIYYRSIK